VVNVLYCDISLSISWIRIASRGHTASQCPQKIDSPPEAVALSSLSEIVPVGQTVTHKPQPLQRSLSICILFSSIAVSLKIYQGQHMIPLLSNHSSSSLSLIKEFLDALHRGIENLDSATSAE
jgi:hypothetical protein